MLLHKIAITLIPNIGEIRAKNLIAYCGGLENVFNEKKEKLAKIPGIGSIAANSFSNLKDVFKRAEEEIVFIEKHKITPLFYLDKEYPFRLKQCADSPLMLYYRGNADLNNSKILSIVGTRTATDYGKSITKKIVNGLSDLDILIVSGLAYGIDICAHKASMQNNLKTVGVLGHGLDRIYPDLHRGTAKKMLDCGGLLTKFMSKTKPDKMNFPERNAIIAGLADAVVIIESKMKGGALITGEIANSYSRDVFAVPGKVGDKCSEGCNYFIKANKAGLVENADDIKYFMSWDSPVKKEKQKPAELFRVLTADEQIIVDILKENKESSIDYLCNNTQFSTSKIAELLLNLEFAGIIKSNPGKIYQLQ